MKRYLKRVKNYLLHGLPVVKAEVFITESNDVLKDRTILITGGGRGLGFAMAKRFVAEKATVVLVGRNEDVLQAAKEQIDETYAESSCFILCGDVTSKSFRDEIFESAEKVVGSPIDSLVSNAGISLHEGNILNVSEQDWDKQFDTNLKAGYFLCKGFIKYLEQSSNQGNILVVTSERARRPDDIPYGLTKVASDSYIKALAVKLLNSGIRVNGIAPGVTCSDMTGYSPDDDLCNSWQNNGRIFLPEEVAEVACFLLSKPSACINGEIITCNQGNHIACW